MNGELINVRGKKLYVEQHGEKDKPAVLFLHGGPGAGCADFSHFQAEKLKREFKFITFDQRGTWRSEAVSETEQLKLNDYIADCEFIRQHLGIRSWSLIGHDFGVFLSLLYASQFPQSIDKLVFIDASFELKPAVENMLKKTSNLLAEHGMREDAESCRNLLEENRSVKELWNYLELYYGRLEDKAIEVYTPHFGDPRERLSFTEQEWDEFNEKAVSQMEQLLDEGEILKSGVPILKTAAHPMLLIAGKYDPLASETEVELFKRHVRRGSLVLFDHTGHFPYAEEPEKFAYTVIGFLK